MSEQQVEELMYVAIVLAVASGVFLVINLVLMPWLRRVATRHGNTTAELLLNPKLFPRLGLVVALGLLLGYLGASEETRFLNSSWSLRILKTLFVIASGNLLAYLLGVLGELYRHSGRGSKVAIKSYVQLAQLGILFFTLLLAAVALTGQQVAYYLSGLGAMLAVLMLVFRDTILSFVAVLRIGHDRMIARGDWVEIPDYGVDGIVKEIALHTVKVENWNKTISTVPTFKVVDTPMKNWRGMEISGGRRIKRCIYMDVTSIRFLSREELTQLGGRIGLLHDWVKEKLARLGADAGETASLSREAGMPDRLTNMAVFRTYALNYLLAHPALHSHGFTCMVRELQPSEHGLPVEIYAFTNIVDWIEYERIQADILDHMLAMLSSFDLRSFQTGLLEGLAGQGVQLYDSALPGSALSEVSRT